jgi:chromosomal replication initiator protein
VAGIRACLLVKALWFLYNLGIKGRLFSNAFLRAASPFCWPANSLHFRSKSGNFHGSVSVVSTLFSIPRKARGAHAPARRGAAGRYVGGTENLLVRSLEQVIAGAEPTWNPIVLSGVTGTGKSLLLDLFAGEFTAAFPQTQIITTTGADYARAFADACDADSIGDFRQKFGRAQLLAIDDLHRLVGKNGAEQELIHLLDALTRRGSLVVATMRHSPLDTQLCPMLQSRLSAGLVIPVIPPKPEARREIVANLAQEQQVELPPAVLESLANPQAMSWQSLVTVPQLRHAVMELAQRAKSKRSPIDSSWLDELAEQERPEARAVMKHVAAAIAKQFQQSVADLRGQTRRQSVVQPRNLAMHLCRRLTGSSYASIGRYFGNRDHTTVLHSCRKAATELAENVPLQRLIEELAASLAAEER